MQESFLPGTFDADSRGIKGAAGPVKILVTEPHQMMNVEKFAKDKGKKPTSVQKDGYYEVVIE